MNQALLLYSGRPNQFFSSFTGLAVHGTSEAVWHFCHRQARETKKLCRNDMTSKTPAPRGVWGFQAILLFLHITYSLNVRERWGISRNQLHYDRAILCTNQLFDHDDMEIWSATSCQYHCTVCIVEQFLEGNMSPTPKKGYTISTLYYRYCTMTRPLD